MGRLTQYFTLVMAAGFIMVGAWLTYGAYFGGGAAGSVEAVKTLDRPGYLQYIAPVVLIWGVVRLFQAIREIRRDEPEA